MKIRENTVLKTAAFLLAVACFAAGAILGWYQLANIEVLWGDSDPGQGHTVRNMEYQDYDDIRELISIYNDEALDGELNAYSERYKTELEARFDPAVTNLRWYAVSADGKARYGNTDQEVPNPALAFFWNDYYWESVRFSVTLADGANWLEMEKNAVSVPESYTIHRSAEWREDLMTAMNRAITARDNSENAAGEVETIPVVDATEGAPVAVTDTLSDEVLDAVYLSEDGTTDVLMIEYGGQIYIYGPTVRSMLEPNQFGYMWDGGWYQTGSGDLVGSQLMDVYLWLEQGLPVDDAYAREITTLREWHVNRELALVVTAACLVVGLLLTVFLCVTCGHKRGYPGVWLNWFHRIPGDVMLAVLGGGGLLLCIAVSEWFYWSSSFSYLPLFVQNLLVGAVAAAMVTLVMGFLVTFVARCKGRTLLRNTVIWRLCSWCWRGCIAILSAIPLIWKVLVVGLAWALLMTACRWNGLWIVACALPILFLCLWACQWGKIRKGTKEIIGGRPDYTIDTRWMLPDLKNHAEELNNLGQAISTAVDDRLKSEHFKAELITNVSHDLKTPLTSIINYVDLLKKEPIDDPTVQEYIEVLDRKSQRLKKLTEDLVEASKASTGNMTVIRERIGLVQLADQALAEYEDRLAEKGLTVVRAFPEGEVWVEADGRHLWRMLDNLLSNCAKYALEGTRVYLEVQNLGDRAVLSVKNISRDELNIAPELLMERFVRGDESRTTEGSGLGLSITQSLTELQKGRFDISIDGDLFKATVTLPLAEQD